MDQRAEVKVWMAKAVQIINKHTPESFVNAVSTKDLDRVCSAALKMEKIAREEDIKSLSVDGASWLALMKGYAESLYPAHKVQVAAAVTTLTGIKVQSGCRRINVDEISSSLITLGTLITIMVR